MERNAVKRRLMVLHAAFAVQALIVAVVVWSVVSYAKVSSSAELKSMANIAIYAMLVGHIVFAFCFARFAESVHRSFRGGLWIGIRVLPPFFLINYIRAILWARYYFSVKNTQESGAALSSRWAGLNEKG